MAAYYNEFDPSYQAYLITNKVTGKCYVGITSRGYMNRWKAHIKESGWSRGGWALHSAIRKYGVDSFIVEWIASSWTWECLCEAERVLIAQYNTISPNGYNMTSGGEGVCGLSESMRMQISAKNRGRKHTVDAKEKIGNASRGHEVSPETRELIRSKHIGKKLSEEHKAKLSAAKTGKTLPPRSSEHSARISEGLRRAHARRRSVND